MGSGLAGLIAVAAITGVIEIWNESVWVQAAKVASRCTASDISRG